MTCAIKGDLLTVIQTVQAGRQKLITVLGKFDSGETEILRQAAGELVSIHLNLNFESSIKVLGNPTSQNLDGTTAHAFINQMSEDTRLI